jgi:glucan biosynthesis protein C
MNAQKDTTIETLRGAVIILVVIGHVIGSESDGGMRVSDDSIFRYLYYTFIDPIQMPLFTVIAGWVYALNPVGHEKISRFILKKVMRIIVPMLIVGMSYYLVQYFTPGTNNKSNLIDIWRLLVFPYTLYWYLYSLFIVFISIAIIDFFNKMNTTRHWIIVFSISLIILLLRDLFISYELPNYFSYKGAIYLMPCFILGVGLNRFKSFIQNKFFAYFIPLIFVVSICIQQFSWFKIIDYVVNKETIIGLIIGLTGTMMLLRYSFQANWLIWFGSFAYSIYLFHAFGTAAGRITLKRFDLQSSLLIFIISFMAGLLLPIIVEKILDKFKITRILFLGKN